MDLLTTIGFCIRHTHECVCLFVAGVSRQVPLTIENKGKIAATLYFDMSMYPDFDLIVPSAGGGSGGGSNGGGDEEEDMSRATTAVSAADGGAAAAGGGGPLVPLPSGTAV